MWVLRNSDLWDLEMGFLILEVASKLFEGWGILSRWTCNMYGWCGDDLFGIDCFLGGGRGQIAYLGFNLFCVSVVPGTGSASLHFKGYWI